MVRIASEYRSIAKKLKSKKWILGEFSLLNA
jgi:hypothetical protein